MEGFVVARQLEVQQFVTDDVVKQVKKRFKIVRYDFKSKGGDKEFGYFGSHHFLADLGGMVVEIQVMSRRLWAFKEEAHKIYTKLRSGSDLSKELQKKMKTVSKQMFSKANMNRRKVSKKFKKAS